MFAVRTDFGKGGVVLSEEEAWELAMGRPSVALRERLRVEVETARAVIGQHPLGGEIIRERTHGVRVR